MDNKHYITLRISPSSSKQEIKRAYRRLAMIYHPDRNSTAIAARRFQEITEAYNALSVDQPFTPSTQQRDPKYRRPEQKSEQKEWSQQTKAHGKRKRKQESVKKEAFKNRKFHDLYLFAQYFLRLLAIVFSIAAILSPFILAILIEPIVLAASSFSIIIGSFLLWHIIKNRKTWFKLGKFNTSPEVLKDVFRKPTAHRSNGFCYYSDARASGKPYKVNLVRVLELRKPLDNNPKIQAKYQRKSMSIIIPRSARAQHIHKICAFIRIGIITLSLLFFPVSSILWRMTAGIIAAAVVSSTIMLISHVKAKASYLYTPAFLMKLAIWISVLYSISIFGPGLEVELSSNKYIIIAGLIFLLDMLFDIVTGIFPFYKKLFIPIPKQGKVLTGYYKEGYQNYVEYPIISSIYPLFLWLF